MALSKDEIREHAARYDELQACARAAEARGEYFTAIEHARGAFPFINGMMQFREQSEGASFESIETIDMVLRLAPPLFDTASLDELEALLKAKRRIAKETNVDEKTQFVVAREQIRVAHRLWNFIEANPAVNSDQIAAHLQLVKSLWSGLLDFWVKANLLTVHDDSGQATYGFEHSTDHVIIAKCGLCGIACKGPKHRFLQQQECPRCQQSSLFVLVGPPPSRDSE